VASKEWVIRQYDHEVQGGSVVKPLVGAANDGPSDAAVLRPVLGSRRGIVLAVGMNPRYGELDTYHMAASAIDEAVRNCVSVGADPGRIAILDNFCWGDTDKSETLGSLVRAALACHDVAVALGTPFISGKDSLNNEFRYTAPDGSRVSISIPPSLLISALGQMPDVGRAVTMDLKEPANLVYQVGRTKDELGGSHFALVESLEGGEVPKVDAQSARRTFESLHQAIDRGLVRACHDMSEGGLAVAAAEMAFAGGFGIRIELERFRSGPAAAPVPGHEQPGSAVLLFSESNSRFLCEVRPESAEAFEAALAEVPFALIGRVVESGRMEVFDGEQAVISAGIDTLKQAWQRPLAW
jgi:phosphoribosylformylglycinamidine synthase